MLMPSHTGTNKQHDDAKCLDQNSSTRRNMKKFKDTLNRGKNDSSSRDEDLALIMCSMIRKRRFGVHPLPPK